MATTTQQAAEIQIDRIEAETLLVPIRGTSPLICHKFSETSKRKMLEAMTGKKAPKQKKDPEREFEEAAYRFEDGRYGHPAEAFKQATIGAGRFYGKDVTMTGLRQSMFFGGEMSADGDLLVEITGKEEADGDWPRMREDVVRVGRGGTDLRYRPQFWPWRCILKVTYVASMLTRDSVLSLIDAGGMGVGVGDWRPEKKGSFGCFTINMDEEVEVISER